MGETVFANMVSDMTEDYQELVEDNSVSLELYEQWKREYTWDALMNLRYGQSFCNHFGIQDNRLYYERDWVKCDSIIRVDSNRSNLIYAAENAVEITGSLNVTGSVNIDNVIKLTPVTNFPTGQAGMLVASASYGKTNLYMYDGSDWKWLVTGSIV
jgi:hypothetical protein